MADNTTNEPEKDVAKLTKEAELEDAAFLDNLAKESKEFDKVEESPDPKRACSNESPPTDQRTGQ
jgi:DnaJ family protein C protein 8